MALGHDSILLVGLTGSNQESIMHLLKQRDWNWKTADCLTGAIRELGGKVGMELVLAAEALLDGHGYELTGAVTRRGSSLLVDVLLSDGHVWLPVVERGERTFGRGGIGLAELGSVVDELLGDRVPPKLPKGVAGKDARGSEQFAGESHKVVAAH
jgi:hypothetical protein